MPSGRAVGGACQAAWRVAKSAPRTYGQFRFWCSLDCPPCPRADLPRDLTLANRGRQGCGKAAGGWPDARESSVTWSGNPDRQRCASPLAGLARTLLVACHILLITSTTGGDAALVRAGSGWCRHLHAPPHRDTENARTADSARSIGGAQPRRPPPGSA